LIVSLLPIRLVRLSVRSALKSKKDDLTPENRNELLAIAGLTVTGYPTRSRSLIDRLIGWHSW